MALTKIHIYNKVSQGCRHPGHAKLTLKEDGKNYTYNKIEKDGQISIRGTVGQQIVIHPAKKLLRGFLDDLCLQSEVLASSTMHPTK